MPDTSQFRTDRTYRGRWTITFNNPPINMFVPATIVELRALMTELEADPSVKVVVFQSANPDFFVAHLDVAKAAERPEALGLWRDFVLRLSSSPVVSIAKIRGRTRGIGNEFVLACDMRFASRQSAVFGQPERLASCFCEEEGEKQLVSRGERAHNCRLSGQNGNPDSKTLKPTSACCPATGPWYTHRPTAGPAQHPSHHSGFVRCLAKKPGPRRTVERIKSDG